jgi:hypothetical protein
VEQRLSPRKQRLAGLAARSVLVAAAADRAKCPAVRVDQHLRAGSLGRRPPRPDDRHERDSFAALQCLGRRGQDLFVQMSTDPGFLFQLIDERIRSAAASAARRETA